MEFQFPQQHYRFQELGTGLPAPYNYLIHYARKENRYQKAGTHLDVK